MTSDGLKLVGRGKLYLGNNWDECHLPTKECVSCCENEMKTKELFFLWIKYINVPLSGSTKHMRPVVRLCVCVSEHKLPYRVMNASYILLRAWSRAVKVWFY